MPPRGKTEGVSDVERYQSPQVVVLDRVQRKENGLGHHRAHTIRSIHTGSDAELVSSQYVCLLDKRGQSQDDEPP